MGRNGPIREGKMRKVLVFIAAAILLSACGNKEPTAEQLATADYGRMPKDPKETLMEFMNRFVTGSESAHYGYWSNLSKGWYRIYGGEVRYGYGYEGCVYINAKNRFGVYEGERPYLYIIRNDELVYWERGKPPLNPANDRLWDECASLFKANGIYGWPTPAQMAAADYGRMPKEPRQTVMEHMKTVLINPESARYDKWSNVDKSWMAKDFVPRYGYMGCVYINAKGKQGAYSGLRPTLYVINNDKVILLMMSEAAGAIKKEDNINSSEKEDNLIYWCAPRYETNTKPVTPRQ